jgi:integrase
MKGNGEIYLRGDTWWADYTVRGRRIRKSTGKTSQREADNWLRQRVQEGKEGTVSLEADKITLAELVKTYLDDREDDSVKTDRRKWELYLGPFFGNIKAIDLSKDLFRAYISHRRSQIHSRTKEHPKNATVNRELAVICAALKAACAEGKIRAVPPFPRLKEANPRPGFLSDEGYSKLCGETARVGLWLRAMFEVGVTYGWRVHELIAQRIDGQLKGGLRVGQCDFDNKIIMLNPGETKNEDAREAPMVGQVETLLQACCAGKKPTDYVFTRSDGKPVLIFRHVWRTMCVRAGIPGLLFHDLRRTGRRNMSLAGIPDDTALKIGGWKTDSVARRYNIQGRDMIENARRKMEAHRQQQAEMAQLRHKMPDPPLNYPPNQQVN